MCGIVGIIQQSDVDSKALKAMCNSIAHRGPDGTDTKIWRDHGVGLGHRRLSIIDLSAAGRNPMCNEDGTVWIVFNGEIYNYQQLRIELEAAGHIFRTHTDTEVIIHAYEEWGDEHITRLRGMFAYAVYDRRFTARNEADNFRILLVRDRLGIKPLFYYTDNNTLMFASELKAIVGYPGIDLSEDITALFDYLTYRYIPTPKTPYKNICRLPAGHFLSFTSSEWRIEEYWDVRLDAHSPAQSLDQAIELTRHLLTEAVRLHMVSDVPVGAFLSGGVDSSAVVALMAQEQTQAVKTYSIGFDVAEHSETKYAQLVSNLFNTDHSERIVSAESLRDALPRMVELYDEPFADSSAMPTLRVSALACENVKVVLSGDGGDEVFGGYNWYSTWLSRRKFDFIPLPTRQLFSSGLSKVWPANGRGRLWISDLNLAPLEQYARMMEFFSRQEKRQMLSPDFTSMFKDYDDYWHFRRYWNEDADPMTRMQYLDLKTYLPDDILTKVDRASMAMSLEVRPPLLDHVLVENIFALPAHLRVPGNTKKFLLKKAVEDILPEQILSRPKKGFSSPLKHWVGSEEQWMQNKLAGNTKWFLRSRLGDFDWVRKSGDKSWALLVLQEWFEHEYE